MATVRDVLRTKGHSTWCTKPDSTVFEALQLMAEKNVGALLVIDSTGLVGIFSERDYARKGVLKGRTSDTTFVREVMSDRVVTVKPDQSLEECMELMTDKHIRHLPVMQSRELIGIISIGDVVKSIISEQKFTIDQLEGYITGKM